MSKELKNAVRNYNRMRTLYLKNNEVDYIAPKLDYQTLLNNSLSDEELAQTITSVKDFKTIKDFAQSQDVNFSASIGEVKRFNRTLQEQITKKQSQEKAIREKMVDATPEQIQKLIPQLTDAMYRPRGVESFKNKKAFDTAVKNRQRKLLTTDFHAIAIHKQRTLATLKKYKYMLDGEQLEHVENLIEQIESLGGKAYENFVENNDLQEYAFYREQGLLRPEL